MIINDDSSIASILETSLIDDARVIIYDRHMFIVQAIEVGTVINSTVLFTDVIYGFFNKLECVSLASLSSLV
jgi:hypothetical protein